METLYSCGKCGEMKPREDFYGKGKRDGWCKVCAKARSAAYYWANRDKAREHHREWVLANPDHVRMLKMTSQYKISRDEYTDLMSRVCQICGSSDQLAIDHDHETGEVRGCLCQPCNKGLGFFKDDPERLLAAVQYLHDSKFVLTYEEIS
jgi:hypothetical protein